MFKITITAIAAFPLLCRNSPRRQTPPAGETTWLFRPRQLFACTVKILKLKGPKLMEGTQRKLTRIAEPTHVFPDKTDCEPQTLQKRCAILRA
jgi:hypothetical protein